MNFRAVIFLLLLFAVYFGLHVFLYFSTLHFFSLAAQKIRLTLAIIFFLLSVSFIVAIALTRLTDFILIKYIYIAAAFWIGLAATLFLAFVFAWILIFAFRLDSIKSIVGVLALLLSLIYGLYGSYNAFSPRLKNIDVKIAGLPGYWQGKKIVQLSDAHLGLVNGAFFAKKIVEKANSAKPDLILITGDLFDGLGGKITDFIGELNKLEATHGVYFVTGNHEVYLGVDYALAGLRQTKINILDNQAVNIEGLQLVGVSYPEFGESRDSGFLENIRGREESLPSILMYHSPTSLSQNQDNAGNHQASIYWSPDVNFDIAKKNGINLQLSGHTHAGQIFPYNLIVDYLYKGYGHGLKTEGSFNIYTTSGVGTWGPPMRTGTDSEIAVITLH